MSKRKYDFPQDSLTQRGSKRRGVKVDLKKHSLDSDEEDEHDEAEDELDVDDIEGEEDGIARQDGGIRMTAFNMKEEMEEGHFDKQGHFIWNNEKEIRDNWLDNVDWHKINDESKYNLDPSEQGLGEDSDSSNDAQDTFKDIEIYKKMIKFMKPKETVNKAIKRLGGDQKLSSIERLRRKKAGTLNSNQDCVEMTAFANNILTKTGNMDVYQETFEEITRKIQAVDRPKCEPVLDMYADDFEDKEKKKFGEGTSSMSSSSMNESEPHKELMWEFKWDQNKDEIDGPHPNKQMIKWAEEGHFKTGVWVRKFGENSNFYSSKRIDFELYE